MIQSLQKNTDRMITKWNRVLLTVIALFAFTVVNAQFYPVQTTTQLIPPYSVYLSDYATGGNEKLRVILLQRDLTQPSYQLRLVMTVELNGQVIMRTSRSYNPAPINLNPGIPTVISGAELAPYVDSRNIDFVGYSRDQYERTKALPEGSYQITFTAYDYRRQDVQVSNAGISFYYLSKNEPPLINFPACGTKVPMRTPQQIVFSWLSRNTASPNSAGDTEFELSLFETRPEGRNPNDVVLSTQPVFRITVDLPQYIYSPSDPLLLNGMKYVWRVRAIDRNGKDAFRNNGYSEVCTFTYGGTDPDFDMGVVKNLQAEGETERKGRIWWDLGDYDGYVANYRKTGEGYEWFTSTITKEELTQAGKTQGEVKLFDLEPDTEYETRVQPKKSGFLGAYTEIIKFRTKPHIVAQCGVNPNLPQADLTRPLRSGIKGMLIQVDDIEIQLMDVLHLGDGWYKGTGRTSIPYFGGAVFAVTFDRLYIDESRIAGFGKIDFVTKGVAALVEQQAVNIVNNKAQLQQANRDQWAGTDFYEKIFVYNDVVIAGITSDATNTISVVDNAGNVTVNSEITQLLVTSPDKAIIIQDKNGDQYVVEKDGDKTKITKVEGGGLSPATSPAVAQSAVITDKIIVSILQQFQDEITAWISINGKGGEDDDIVMTASSMPVNFPKNAYFLKFFNDEVVGKYKEEPQELRQKIEKNEVSKSLFNQASAVFSSEADVDFSKLSGDQQQSTRDVVAELLMEVEQQADEPNIIADCGFKQNGNEKNFWAKILVRYAQECEYFDSGIAEIALENGMGKFLCVEDRFKLIKCVAQLAILNYEEEIIIGLIKDAPTNQKSKLLEYFQLDSDGLLAKLKSRFQLQNYVTLFQELNDLYVKGTPLADINKAIGEIDKIYNSDVSRDAKAKSNAFYWFEGGILKQLSSDNFIFGRFDNVSISNTGDITLRYATDPNQTGSATTFIHFKPFELVGFKVRGNSNELLDAKNAFVYVPAILIPALVSEEEWNTFHDALNSAMFFTGVSTIVSSGGRLILAGGIDVLFGGSALVVENYKDDILAMSGGEAFIEKYILVNKAFAAFWIGRTGIFLLAKSLPLLKASFTSIKTSEDFLKLKATNSSKAAEIEKEVSSVLTKGDDILQNLVIDYDKLGVPKSINLTGFNVNTSVDYNKYIEVIVHFENGGFKVLVEEGGAYVQKSLATEQLAAILNRIPNDKSIRLLSCNDLAAAKELSAQLSGRPLYASDGWVDLYADGAIQSEHNFKKLVNGEAVSEAAMGGTANTGAKKIRLGDETLANGGNKFETLPSKMPDPNAVPRGSKTKISDLADIETKTSLIRENEGADILARKGYDIEQNPITTNTNRKPDYKIEGEIFDCYSPYNPNKPIRGIWDEVLDKVVTKKQTERVFLHLKNWSGKIDDLQKQFNDYPIEGLKEVMILDNTNNIIHLTLK